MFLVWQTGISRAKNLGDVALYKWLTDNFSASWENLRSGRVWTLVTSAFSHAGLGHLAINMLVLHSFGGDIVRLVGVRRFLWFYLGAAVCGNAFSAAFNGLVRGSPGSKSIGASTSVVGVTTLFACVYPTATLQVFLFIPAPAWLVAVGFIGWDMWRMFSARQSRVDGAGHLGGAAAGIAYYWFRLRPVIRRMR